ncbi:ephrin-B2a-like [Synchiropus splendidus]|uniref:ephrin-B2a-like n=1 Tax=Synchiropus splendidus TaxID=270530 RepID=UPI00237D38A1|nr:ephrin-B2a-like [Synchiropus splendidus]
MGTITWSFAAVILLPFLGSCRAVTLESVHWSSSNSKFTAGQGLVLYPQIGDKMDIVCPRVDPSKGGREEFYRVYLVTRSQMESCTIDKADTPLLNCDKPGQDVKFTFKFQEFSPNLWGLEFLKGRDYYITSTSTGSLQSLDSTEGGVCRTKSMKLLLRVGQSPSDPDATLKESPTRFPPTRKKPKVNKLPSANEEGAKSKTDAASETGQNNPSGSGGSAPRLFIWVVAGCAILLLIIVAVVLILWKCRRRHCIPDHQQSTSVSLSTLAVPKRDSISSDNNGSDRSDVVFPLRPSESMICRHFERVSGDYGPPVYIVQEITPQTPTNIYYKV